MVVMSVYKKGILTALKTAALKGICLAERKDYK